MPKLSDEERERLVEQTVDVLLELRRAYLLTGASPLKAWDQITDRLRASARTTANVAEWITSMNRGLQLGAPSRQLSSAIERLSVTVGARAVDWLDLLEREHGYVIAKTRMGAEKRKSGRSFDAES